MKNLLHTLIVTGLIATGTFAQSRTVSQPNFKVETPSIVSAPAAVRANAVDNLDMTGLENNPGTFYAEMNRWVGNTFVLSGEFEGLQAVLTVSLEHQGQTGLFPGSKVSGGSWTMTVHQDGVYQGTTFGNVTGGYITWSYDPINEVWIGKNTSLEMRASGAIDEPVEPVEGRTDAPAEMGTPMQLNINTVYGENGGVTTGYLKNPFFNIQ